MQGQSSSQAESSVLSSNKEQNNVPSTQTTVIIISRLPGNHPRSITAEALTNVAQPRKFPISTSHKAVCLPRAPSSFQPSSATPHSEKRSDGRVTASRNNTSSEIRSSFTFAQKKAASLLMSSQLSATSTNAVPERLVTRPMIHVVDKSAKSSILTLNENGIVNNVTTSFDKCGVLNASSISSRTAYCGYQNSETECGKHASQASIIKSLLSDTCRYSRL